MTETDLIEPDRWCALSLPERRERLARALLDALEGAPGVVDTRTELGPKGREYDLTAVVESDVGLLRAPLWSHARATIFCDSSIHPANRKQLAPAHAVAEAADALRRRLSGRFTLESRGLVVEMEPEPGVKRTWTAERSRFRNRTSVTREDLIANAAEVDVRDLLAHFYSGPSLRLEGDDGSTFLLPGRTEAEGRLVSLCEGCQRWMPDAAESCSECGAPAEVIIAARPAKR